VDEDEDSDQGDEEASCGALGKQKGVGGEEKAQYHKEDGKRAIEGVNNHQEKTADIFIP
jgi:hypothetical protein